MQLGRNISTRTYADSTREDKENKTKGRIKQTKEAGRHAAPYLSLVGRHSLASLEFETRGQAVVALLPPFSIRRARNKEMENGKKAAPQ